MTIVTYSAKDQIAELTISRPERRNALNYDGVAELLSGVEQANKERVRALVIHGSHGHFCAGADLKELEDLTFTRALRTALDALSETTYPTIAAISGSCRGLGAQISLACDLRLATPDANFAVPVAKLGLMVDQWTLQRLALLAGQSTARWMTLTAQPIDAQRAYEVGFVHQIVGQGEDPSATQESHLIEEAQMLARSITHLAPLSLSGTKLGLNQLEQSAKSLDPYETYRSAFETAWASNDLIEGRAAFNERRKAKFEGK